MKKIGSRYIGILTCLLLLSGYSTSSASQFENVSFTMGSESYEGADGLKYCRYQLTVEGSNWGWFNAIVSHTGYNIKPNGTRGPGSYTCSTQDHGNYKFSNYRFMSGSSRH